eukprot:3114512-Pyramimonas_sp.AAC.1
MAQYSCSTNRVLPQSSRAEHDRFATDVVRRRLVTKYSMAIIWQSCAVIRGERARRTLASAHSRAATRPFNPSYQSSAL